MKRRPVLVLLLSSLCVPALAQAPQPKQPETRTTPAPNQPEAVQAAPVPVTPDEPGAVWMPASEDNYQTANRPASGPIDMVIVHDIEGSALGAVSWFQNPKAEASSHYVVDSVAGKVYQMVPEKDVAWHAGNLAINRRSIGIEHEGYAYRPGFFNPGEYETAARLIRDITRRYSIPRDRKHIIGHDEVPDPRRPGQFGGSSGHTDPGPYWDWDALMTLIRNDGRLVSHTIPTTIRPGELKEATVLYTNTGDDAWVSNASGVNDPRVVEMGGGVYLGTWNPAGRMSPFFNYKYWTSPRMASSLENGDTAPGGQGTFTFSLLGPRRLGTYIEEFRPVKVPPMPRAPVYFGDAFTAAVNVVPWDLTVTAKEAGVAPADWNAKDGVYWRKSGEGPAFPWTAPLTVGGKYDVYARWTPGASHTRAATYEIAASDGAKTVTVDQRTGGAWVKLGRFRFDDPKAARVLLRAQATTGIIVAGDVRMVGPFD